MKSKLKAKMCEQLLKSGSLKLYDTIRHSYTTRRIKGEMKDITENNICPTLDTRCDCLGVVVDDKKI